MTMTKKIGSCLVAAAMVIAASAATALGAPPDMVVQFRNISSTSGCMSALEKAGLLNLLDSLLTANLASAGVENPQPDLRSTDCANGRETIGIWLTPPALSGSDSGSARATSLTGIGVISGSETFGVRGARAALVRMVGEKLDEKGRRLNLEGQPDPDGTVLLDSHALNFSGSKVHTTIDGHVEVPVLWDFYFEVHQEDTLWLDNGVVKCSSAAPYVEDDSTWYDIAQFVTGNFLDVLTQVVLNDYGFRWISGKIGAQMSAGPGCGMAGGIPDEIMLPETQTNLLLGTYGTKLVMNYSRLNVDSAGITAAGTYRKTMRQPEVWVGAVGGTIIRSDDLTWSAQFRYQTDDLRPPFTSVTWSAPDSAGATPSGVVTWQLSSRPLDPGAVRTVSVKITDADGITASGTVTVHLQYSLTPDDPPICDTQPTHYECEDHPEN